MKWIFTIVLVSWLSLSGFNRISTINKYLENAYTNYLQRDFSNTISSLNFLTDSLSMENDGLLLNKAHSTYLLSQKKKPGIVAGDSVTIKAMQQALDLYKSLWVAADNSLQSIAYNQGGIITFKTLSVNGKTSTEEEAIRTAIDFFKMALVEDPTNNAARYNYELLKKYLQYPDDVMNRAKNLVSQRKFEEAYTLLAGKVESDSRFAKHQEFIKRLTDIIKIEQATHD